MRRLNEEPQSFAMSSAELRRREKAFDRLGASTVLAFAVGSADLFATHAPVLLAGIAGLSALVIASRIWLAAGNRRYAHTTWSLDKTTLTRTDSRCAHEYQLDAIRDAQAKRTTAGVIREIKLGFNDGSTVYANGLEDAEAFWECLNARRTDVPGAAIREPIDYDHPAFYVVLGVVLGASISLVARLGISSPQLSGHWAYVALAVYSFAFGVYWLRARPISGRYGIRAVTWDYGLAAGALLCCVGSAVAATAL